MDAALQAKHAGLGAFVLTEHFHAPDFWGMYDHLRRHFAYADGVFQVDDGLRILTGAEPGNVVGLELEADSRPGKGAASLRLEISWKAKLAADEERKVELQIGSPSGGRVPA
jgi:hypothetical protein